MLWFSRVSVVLHDFSELRGLSHSVFSDTKSESVCSVRRRRKRLLPRCLSQVSLLHFALLSWGSASSPCGSQWGWLSPYRHTHLFSTWARRLDGSTTETPSPTPWNYSIRRKVGCIAGKKSKAKKTQGFSWGAEKPELGRSQRPGGPSRPQATPETRPTCSHSEAELLSAVQALNLPCLSSRAKWGNQLKELRPQVL